MARLLAGRQLVIERSDIDLLLAHLHGWVPKGKSEEFSDLIFLNGLHDQPAISQEAFETFAHAYTLESAFSRQFVIWTRVFNEILLSDGCHQRLETGTKACGEGKKDATIDLITWRAGQTKELNDKRQSSASSKFAMFLWPCLPIFINDSKIRKAASDIHQGGERQSIGRHRYQTLWERCAILYNPVRDRPFITCQQVAIDPAMDHLTDDWLSRRLLDLALYHAVIVDSPAPPPSAPRIVFCQCALPEAAHAAAA